jgi:3-oxoacyl-[acyl-carrier protein] reductase
MINLKGKRALVTGGGTGIGRAICLAFAENGSNVGIHYMSSKDEAEKTFADAKKLDVEAILLQGDLTKEDAVNKVVESFCEHFGGIDILVNNAGGLIERCPVSEMSATLWDAVVNVNIKTAFSVQEV